MGNAEIFVAKQCADIYGGGKPRKIVFVHGVRPSPDEHCTATIENNTLIAKGLCYAALYDNVLVINGSCGAAIENNILYAVGG